MDPQRVPSDQRDVAPRMKIVDVSDSFSTRGGGVRSYVLHKLAAAANAGHELVVVAPGERDTEECRAGGRVIWIAGPRSPVDRAYGFFADERALHRVLARERPDVIEASSPWAGARFVASWPGSALRVLVFHTDPVAVWGHTLFSPRIGFDAVDTLCAPWWRRFAKLSARFDATIASGEWLVDRLRRHGVARAEAVPFGVDKRRFAAAAPDAALRSELLARCGASPHARLLVAVSRLDPEKRVGTVLDAFARARRDRALALVVCGRGSLQRWWGARIAAMPGACLLGFVDPGELPRVLASADAFVHGSAAETYGLAVGEAICAGLPAIVPDRGGAAALVRGGAGERYATGDAEACAAAIGRVLAQHRELARAACRRAANDIADLEDHFTALFARYGGTGLREAG
jgi:alpha-1,6-mannosyltransferase